VLKARFGLRADAWNNGPAAECHKRDTLPAYGERSQRTVTDRE
jgi:hypothetical protein